MPLIEPIVFSCQFWGIGVFLDATPRRCAYWTLSIRLSVSGHRCLAGRDTVSLLEHSTMTVYIYLLWLPQLFGLPITIYHWHTVCILP